MCEIRMWSWKRTSSGVAQMDLPKNGVSIYIYIIICSPKIAMWENNGERGMPCSETNTDISKTFQDRADGLNLSEKSGFQVRRDKFHTFFCWQMIPMCSFWTPQVLGLSSFLRRKANLPLGKNTISHSNRWSFIVDWYSIYIYYIVGYQPMVTLLIFKQLVIFQLPSRIDEISNRKCRLRELELMKICPPRRLQTELSRSPLKNAWVT